MRSSWIALALIACPLIASDAEFNGRWDITVPDNARNRAWWLEVTGAGTGTLKGRFVGAPGGDMDNIPEIGIKNGELIFSFDKKDRAKPGDEPKMMHLVYRARLVNGKLQGTF